MPFGFSDKTFGIISGASLGGVLIILAIVLAVIEHKKHSTQIGDSGGFDDQLDNSGGGSEVI